MGDDDPAEHAKQQVGALESGKYHERRLAVPGDAGNRPSGCETLGLGDGEDYREIAIVVGPFVERGPAAGQEQETTPAWAVFVAVFGVDARPLGKVEGLSLDRE